MTFCDMLGEGHFVLPVGRKHIPIGGEYNFCPFTFYRGNRCNENLGTACFVVLDFDRLTAEQRQKLFAFLVESGLAYVAYTTKTHNQSKHPCRHTKWEPCTDRCTVFEHYKVLLPLDRVVAPADYIATVDWVLARLPEGVVADPMVRVPSQPWTFPCCYDTPASRADAKFESQNGYLLQAVKAPTPLLQLVPAPVGRGCSLDELKAKLASVHSKNPEIRAATQAILNGEAFPFKEGRMQPLWLKTLTSIARIASNDADLSPEVLEQLITPSLHAGSLAGSHVALSDIRHKIKRALRAVRNTPSTFVTKVKQPTKPKTNTSNSPGTKHRVYQFIKNQLEPLAESRSKKMLGLVLYGHYKDWTRAHGGCFVSNVVFSKILKLAGIRRFDGDNHSSRYAVRLKGQQIQVTGALTSGLETIAKAAVLEDRVSTMS